MSLRRTRDGGADLFMPKLVTVLREGYGWRDLKADLVAGLTVAVVALPLSMAIAIGSGVAPERGLYTSIVGGFLVSALGGSRLQIGGPAGAFIVLVAVTLDQHGLHGLLLAVFLSGLMLVGVGLMRLGSLIRYIPYPVTVGFTAGIAVVIFSGEIADLFGLTLPAKEPGPIIPKLAALWAARGSADPATVIVSALSIALIVAVRRLRPQWPAYLIAVTLASLAAATLHLDVATIGSRFGGIPRTLPVPRLPDLSPARVAEMLPAAAAFALLGTIESLLSAVVADSMSGRRHRSNVELVAQGGANLASALFGGICVTGTIARTATNVRAGARGPVSGMAHAAFVLLFMVVAAPAASYIPLAALAAVLAVVCWSMAERHQVAALLRASRADAAVLLATFGTVVVRDLTSGIAVGFLLATLLFMHRMAQAVGVEVGRPAEASPSPDATLPGRQADIAVVRVTGAFFFGAATPVAIALDRPSDRSEAVVIDLAGVSMIDSSAAVALAGVVRKVRLRGTVVCLAGAGPPIRAALEAHGVVGPDLVTAPDVAAALEQVRRALEGRHLASTAPRPRSRDP